MNDRRTFLGRSATALGALAVAPSHALAGWIDTALPMRAGRGEPTTLAEDEPFWAEVRARYLLDPDVINLDHGWTNPAPRDAVERLVRDARALQALPAERLALTWPEVTNTSVRAALAEVMGVPGDQLALVRNATEALDTVLLGVPLARGDEVVCSAHDYFAMLDALAQRQARVGVVLRMIRPPVPARSPDELLALYEAAIGPRTRLVLLTNPSNLTGQLLPVRRIAAAAHRVGAEVVVDGAQSLGLLEEPVTSLDCDYYGASLHKWLGVPVGTGVLWMKPEHTKKVWPLVPSPPATAGMSRYEWIGTSPEYVAPAALPALAVHGSLGPARKAARLRYLAGYWRARAARALPDARFYTAPDPAMSVGLTTMELDGVDAEALQKELRSRYGILVQAMSGSARTPEIRGIRVSPNVFTSPAELDRLVEVLPTAVRAVRK